MSPGAGEGCWNLIYSHWLEVQVTTWTCHWQVERGQSHGAESLCNPMCSPGRQSRDCVTLWGTQPVSGYGLVWGLIGIGDRTACAEKQLYFVLILNPATSLSSFLSSDSCVCVYSLGFSVHDYIISSVHLGSLTSSFPIWTLCISLPCPIALAGTSSTKVSGWHGERGSFLFLVLGQRLSASHH